ncbi:MAG: single-stranded-DNA-specific exonuclease RecJ [Gammaproteobacteria bacterium]
MRRIVRRQAQCDGAALPAALHPVLRRLYVNRGVADATRVDYRLGRLAAADRLEGTDLAARILERGLRDGASIVVVGDFDADGATSTALALHALRAMGAPRVHYVVPNRFEYGYGLTPPIVELAARKGAEILVTVDNGVSSVEGVAAARARGMTVVITDHHLPGEVLPDAHAMVNPNLPDSAFPSRNLAGVGVIFYVLSALRARLRSGGWFVERGLDEPNMAAYLDLVALGTVADVVPLDDNNRILVDQGLRRIRAGHTRPGIQALIEVSGRHRGTLSATDLGFALGPRLNAAGRLEDMSIGIECLLSREETDARQRAQRLDVLNRERREIEGDMQARALEVLEGLEFDDGPGLPFGICLHESDWHEGVLGIVAARVRERFHRPVVAFAPGQDGQLKGSARSVPRVHIRDALDAVAAGNPGLITRFGGHAMAAGLTLPIGNLDAFRSAFDSEVRRHLDEGDLEGLLHSDGALGRGELNIDTAQVLRAGGPWGQGFPPPLFDDDFVVLSRRLLNGGHLKMMVEGPDGSAVEAIAFRFEHEPPEQGERVHLAYRLDVNEWGGEVRAQLIVEYLERVSRV